MKHKIGFSFLFCLSLFSAEEVYLKTPDLSRENIIAINVGVRPYRKSGVRIEAETLQDKLVIHNYGYGGSGITLSLGGSKEVLDLLSSENPDSKTVAILGAGVAAMTTAYDLLNQGYEVHVYSEDWIPNLTSNVAAGIWSPPYLGDDVAQEKIDLNKRMLETAHKRFSMSTGAEPEFAGVRFIDSYSFKTSSGLEAIKTKNRGEEVIAHFDNGVVKTGRKYQELAIDGKLFMEDLYEKVKANGAILSQRHFASLEAVLRLKEPIIINCTSLGSRELFSDEEFMPVRGQIVYFEKQEGIDYLLYQNVPDSNKTWVSIYPWSDRFIVGGVYEPGEEEIAVNHDLVEMIIRNAEKCLSGSL